MSILAEGDVIRHQCYSEADEYRWEATVIEVQEDDNILKVSIMGRYGQAHPENWNLGHTISGLKMGEYSKCPSKDRARPDPNG